MQTTVPQVPSTDLWVWGEDEHAPRLLHTMFRVADLEASLRFYVGALGMTAFDRYDIVERRVTALFVGYDNYRRAALIELTHRWDAVERRHGTAFGHVAIGVPDVTAMADRVAAAGFEVIEPPQVVMAGGPSVAFVRDPDGFSVELIQMRRPA